MKQSSSPVPTQKTEAQNNSQKAPLIKEKAQQAKKDSKSNSDAQKVRSKSSNVKAFSEFPESTRFMLVFPLIKGSQWKYEAKDFSGQKVDNRCTIEEINQVFADIYKAVENFKVLKASEKTSIFACFSSGKSGAARKEGLTAYTKVKQVLDSHAAKFLSKGLRFNLNGQSVDWIELHLDYLKPSQMPTENTQIYTQMNSVIFETARRDSEDKAKALKVKTNFELAPVSQKNTAPYRLSNSASKDENTKSPVQTSDQNTENNLRGESSLPDYNKPNASITVRTPFKEVVSNTPVDDSSNALIQKSNKQENSTKAKRPFEYVCDQPAKIFTKRSNDLYQFEDLNVIPNNSSNKVQSGGYSRGRKMDNQDEDVPDDDGEGESGIQLQDSSLLQQSSAKRQQIITRI